jgi:uncharacterized protein
MEATPANVRDLAKRAENGNWELRQYLKQQSRMSEEKVDAKVVEITDRIWAGFDCTTCANCCKELAIGLTDSDIERLAVHLGMPTEQFRASYLRAADQEESDEDVHWVMRSRPCPMLKENRCTVYEHRPEQCRGYPYLHEKDFSFRTMGMIERTATCPIVYEVFEELKGTMGRRRGGR